MACAGPRAVSSSPEEGEIHAPPSFPLKVAVAVFEDLRPPEDRDVEARRLLGDGRYPYYTYDEEPVITSLACGFMGLCAVYTPQSIPIALIVNRRLVERLRAARLFAQVEPLTESASDGPAPATPEMLNTLKDEGFDAILVGRLARWYGLSYPFFSGPFYTVFSGTVEYPKQNKVAALIRIEQVQLVSLKTGLVLGAFEAEYAIDRQERRTTARKVANEALEGAMNQLLERLSTAGVTILNRP